MAENPRIEELRRRVQADPASIAFAALAEEFRRVGRHEDAIETCRTGLQRHPAYLSARVTLGRALIETGDYDGAREELETVLRSAPENLAAIRGLAQIHERLGHSTEMDPHLAELMNAGGGPDRGAAAPGAGPRAVPERPPPPEPVVAVLPAEPEPEPSRPSPSAEPVSRRRAGTGARAERVGPGAGARVRDPAASEPEPELVFAVRLVRSRDRSRPSPSRSRRSPRPDPQILATLAPPRALPGDAGTARHA